LFFKVGKGGNTELAKRKVCLRQARAAHAVGWEEAWKVNKVSEDHCKVREAFRQCQFHR
jgi:hypothetical protein